MDDSSTQRELIWGGVIFQCSGPGNDFNLSQTHVRIASENFDVAFKGFWNGCGFVVKYINNDFQNASNGSEIAYPSFRPSSNSYLSIT